MRCRWVCGREWECQRWEPKHEGDGSSQAVRRRACSLAAGDREHDGDGTRASIHHWTLVLEGPRPRNRTGPSCRPLGKLPAAHLPGQDEQEGGRLPLFLVPGCRLSGVCLLYTSDAADDLTRVDLGGRRVIK